MGAGVLFDVESPGVHGWMKGQERIGVTTGLRVTGFKGNLSKFKFPTSNTQYTQGSKLENMPVT